MKKLINLIGILSLFFLFSCSNLIENNNTSVRVVLPEAENVARTIGISYELADVAEYTIVFEGEKFNNTYNCNPGDDLYIEDFKPGDYKVTGYANDANGNCIAYGVTVTVVMPFVENSCELVLKKNIISNIATVIPTRTKDLIELSSKDVIDTDALISDIQLKVTYLSGYETTVGLSEITDTGFFFVKTYLVYDEDTRVETNKIDYSAKKLVLEVCMYDCDFNEFVKAQKDEELKQALLEKQIALFEFSYGLELSNITFQIYDDEDTIDYHEETFDAKNDIEFEEPVARSGFEFAGWYYFNGDTEVEKLEDNKILISNLSKYLDAEGCIRGKWKLVNLNAADLSKFNSANYPNGFTLKLDDTNFSKDAAGYSALNKNLYLKKEYNSDLLINLDMYECEIGFFAYQLNIDGVDTFEDVYFSNNVNLRSIKLPNVEDFFLSPNTFENCLNLQEVYIPKDFEGSNAAFSGIYNDCKFIVEEGATYVTNVINGVTYDSMLFSVPGSPEEPEYLLYEDCRKVGDRIKIPEGVTSLVNSYNGVNVDLVKLPKSLINIGSAFEEANISKFEIESENDGGFKILHHDEVDAYEMLIQKVDDTNWLLLYDCAVTNERYERLISNDVTIINTGVYKNRKLKKVKILATVTKIQANAFKDFDGVIELQGFWRYDDGYYAADDDNAAAIAALRAGTKIMNSD